MPNRRNPLNRLTSSQLLMVLVFLVVVALVKYWIGSPGPGITLPPTITPFQSIPAIHTPRQPNDLPPTLTPVVDIPSPDSLSEFDYFLLALSWSPDYCATSGSDDPQQCATGRKLGFVLHGLWPQYERGYPSDCTTEKLTTQVKNQFPGLYPSEALYDHEWEKHGTCTGLSPTSYLALSKRLKESVSIPDAYRSPEAPFRTNAQKLQQEFILANKGFNAASLAVNCSSNGRYLKELDVCFSRDGKPTACSTEVQKSALKTCQNSDFLVRNIR
jgi:ribonuclease T2